MYDNIGIKLNQRSFYMYNNSFCIYLILLFSPVLATEDVIHNLVIVGSGPAGLTAAIYAGRAGLNPLVICGKTPGGQLTMVKTISNWPGYATISGSDLITMLLNHAKGLGTEYLEEEVVSLDSKTNPFVITTGSGKKIRARSIIIATGTKQKMLSCPGEQTYWGKGISHCALCDGLLYKNKNVLVIGGGNAALENALHLKNFTKNITIITSDNGFTADSQIKNKILQDPDYTIYYNCTVKEFLGDETGLTQANLIFEKTKEIKIIPVNGAFIAIGFTPNTGLIPNLEYDFIYHSDTPRTSINGIFIAINDRYRQAIVSAGLGCCAAIEAMKYLDK